MQRAQRRWEAPPAQWAHRARRVQRVRRAQWVHRAQANRRNKTAHDGNDTTDSQRKTYVGQHALVENGGYTGTHVIIQNTLGRNTLLSKTKNAN